MIREIKGGDLSSSELSENLNKVNVDGEKFEINRFRFGSPENKYNKMLLVINMILETGKELNKIPIIVDWGSSNAVRIIETLKNVGQKEDYLLFIIPPVGWNKVKNDSGFTIKINDKEIKMTDVESRMKELDGLQYLEKIFRLKLKKYNIIKNDIVFGELTAYSVILYRGDFYKLNNKADNKEALDFLKNEIIKTYSNITDRFDLDKNKKFEGAMKLDIENKINNLNKNIGVNNNSLERLDEDIKIYKTQIANSNKQIKELIKKKETIGTKEVDLFNQLIKNKMYTSFIVDNDNENSPSIIGFTTPIHIKRNKSIFVLGEFMIKIYLHGEIEIRNLTKTYIHLDHPHIERGRPCLGNIKLTTQDLMKRGEYTDLFCLLYDFLVAYNPGGPYVTLEKGWGLKENWCFQCDNLKTECRCKDTKCPDCGNLTRECTCFTCPDSEEKIPEGAPNDDYCEDCSDYNSGLKECRY